MAFTYGSEALNQLAQEVSREPADLSQKADVTALATTNAVVQTKQTQGEPPKLGLQTVSTDAIQDPDFAGAHLDASANDVTLTLVAGDTVNLLAFVFLMGDSTHRGTLAAHAGDFIIAQGKTRTGFVMPTEGFALTLLSTTVGGNRVWIAVGEAESREPVAFESQDTTVSSQTTTLPPADNTSARVIWVYKNTGTGSHAFTVNRAGSDTINGGTAGIAIADGKAVAFYQFEPGGWVTIAGP